MAIFMAIFPTIPANPHCPPAFRDLRRRTIDGRSGAEDEDAK
jgi:hypothetical protein